MTKANQAVLKGTMHTLPSGRLVAIYYGQAYLEKLPPKPVKGE